MYFTLGDRRQSVDAIAGALNLALQKCQGCHSHMNAGYKEWPFSYLGYWLATYLIDE